MLKFESEQKAWELGLRKKAEKVDFLNHELEISLSNCEKLQLIIKNLKNEPKTISKEIQTPPKKMNLDIKKGQNELKQLQELKTQQDFMLGVGTSPDVKKIKEEVEFWKRKTSQLELSLLETNSIVNNLRDYEVRIINLMGENDSLKGKEGALRKEIDASRGKIEENDALKLKVNKLEVALTELRLEKGKSQKG